MTYGDGPCRRGDGEEEGEVIQQADGGPSSQAYPHFRAYCWGCRGEVPSTHHKMLQYYTVILHVIWLFLFIVKNNRFDPRLLLQQTGELSISRHIL